MVKKIIRLAVRAVKIAVELTDNAVIAWTAIFGLSEGCFLPEK